MGARHRVRAGSGQCQRPGISKIQRPTHLANALQLFVRQRAVDEDGLEWCDSASHRDLGASSMSPAALFYARIFGVFGGARSDSKRAGEDIGWVPPSRLSATRNDACRQRRARCSTCRRQTPRQSGPDVVHVQTIIAEARGVAVVLTPSHSAFGPSPASCTTGFTQSRH